MKIFAPIGGLAISASLCMLVHGIRGHLTRLFLESRYGGRG